MSDCGCNKLSNGAGQFVDITGLCDLSIINDIEENPYWTQISIPTVFNIPGQKPDLGDLHSENISVEIISQKVIVTPGGPTPPIPTPVENLEGKILTGRKLLIEGLLCKAITYTALSEDQPMHTAHATIPFSAYIVLPLTIDVGTPPVTTDTLTLNFEIIPCIEDVFIKEISNRQIFQNITLFLQAVPTPGTVCNEEGCNSADQVDIKGVATREQLEAIVIGASPDDLWTQFVVSENLRVPSRKPDIEQINSLNSYIEIISQRVVSTPNSEGADNLEGTALTGKKLIIEGILKQKITYTADIRSGSQPLHSLHFDVPFSVFIMVPDTVIGSSLFKIEPYIEDIFVCARSSREVFKNTTIFIKATQCV